MSYFQIDPSRARTQLDELEQVGNRLRETQTGIDRVSDRLGRTLSQSSGLKRQMKKCSEKIFDMSVQAKDLRNGLESMISLYEKSEEKTVDNLGKRNHTEGDEEELSSRSVSLLNGSVSGAASILGIRSAGSLSGELAGASYSTKFGAGIHYKYDEDGNRKFDSVKAEASATGEVHAAKGEVSGNIGYLSGKVSGTVGTASATGAIGAALFRNGKLAPQIYGKVSAKAVALEGKSEIDVGTDNYNVHAKASGDVLKAEAKAEAQLGKITYKDASGDTATGYGAKAEAGAEAYLATGKVSGGITVFGIDIDIGLSGKAGGAGGTVGAYATTGGVKGSVSAGLGVGLGLDISIDWSDFKFGW